MKHYNLRRFPGEELLGTFLPVLLMLLVFVSWGGWFGEVRKVTNASWRFLVGRYSLVDAYSHQFQGLPIGGINPGAYEAFKHVPSGERVWSTNVDSYCMVPNCIIESVVSYKLSSRLDEILVANPEDAKLLLQKEGLNYFIFSSKSRIIDLLPYSPLFRPETVGRYFGIKWTDGETYLLTWKDQTTSPITPKFNKSYYDKWSEDEHPWFAFRQAIPKMNKAMRQIASLPHPWKAIAFPTPDEN